VKQKMLDMYKLAFESIKEETKLMIEAYLELEGQLQDPEIDEADTLMEVADMLYAMKETYNMHDEMRKALGRLIRGKLQPQLCKEMALRLSDEGIMQTRSVRTEWTVATPRYDTQVPLPKTDIDDPKYVGMCQFLDIPQDVINSEVVKFNWKGFGKILGEKLEQGLPLPEGHTLNDVYFHYSVSCRKKKDLLCP
jgi:hypothetical protein